MRYGLPAFGVYIAMVVLIGLKFGRIRPPRRARLARRAGMSVLVANVAMGLTQNHLVYGHAMYPSAYFVYLTYGVLLGSISRRRCAGTAPEGRGTTSHAQQSAALPGTERGV